MGVYVLALNVHTCATDTERKGEKECVYFTSKDRPLRASCTWLKQKNGGGGREISKEKQKNFPRYTFRKIKHRVYNLVILNSGTTNPVKELYFHPPKEIYHFFQLINVNSALFS